VCRSVIALNNADREVTAGARAIVAMWVASAGSGRRVTVVAKPLGGPARVRFSTAQPSEMCNSRSSESIVPMVRDMSANTSMRSFVTVNSQGWVLWAFAARIAARTRFNGCPAGEASAQAA
jgi:hypothetical protein